MFSQLISAMRALMLVISVMSLETAVKMRAMLITYLKELLQELEQDQKKDEDALRPMQMKRVMRLVIPFLIRFRERHRGMRMLNCILHMGSRVCGIRGRVFCVMCDKNTDANRGALCPACTEAILKRWLGSEGRTTRDLMRKDRLGKYYHDPCHPERSTFGHYYCFTLNRHVCERKKLFIMIYGKAQKPPKWMKCTNICPDTSQGGKKRFFCRVCSRDNLVQDHIKAMYQMRRRMEEAGVGQDDLLLKVNGFLGFRFFLCEPSDCKLSSPLKKSWKMSRRVAVMHDMRKHVDDIGIPTDIQCELNKSLGFRFFLTVQRINK